MPRVSVNIPAYNAEAFLARALRSVEAQTFGDFEIVLVDDGSTDGTAEIAHSFASVRYVRQAHSGEAEARRRGLAESHGELVAFLDADDEWLPEKLERQVTFMEERQSQFSYADAYQVKNSKRVRYSRLAHPFEGQILASLLGEWLEQSFILPTQVVARRQLLEDVGGFDCEAPFHSNTDYGLWLRIALAGTRFDYLNEPLAIYYRGHKSDSSDGVVMLERYLQALDYFSERLPFPPEAQDLLERTRARAKVALGAKLLERGRIRAAMPYLRHGKPRDLAAKTWLFLRRRLSYALLRSE